MTFLRRHKKVFHLGDIDGKLPPKLIVPVKINVWKRFKRWFYLTFSKPELDAVWTTIYYGAKGSCKSICQAVKVTNALAYYDVFHEKHPNIPQPIIFTNQKFNEDIERKYLGRTLFYWKDFEEIEHCPRHDCWRERKLHRLHGAYLVMDDIASIIPAGAYKIPNWIRKLFSQARKNSVHVLANLQDPFSCHIDFRRYVDRAYKFSKVMGTRDPDETKLPLKRIWGMYRRRKIDAEMLWMYGDMPEQAIRMMLAEKAETDEKMKKEGKRFEVVYDDSWKGSYHIFGRKKALLYDTTQDIKKYEPKGYKHSELKCLDPDCDFVHVNHDIV
jgi:hypothetical protein